MTGDIWTLWLRLKNNFGVHILVEINVINIFVLPDPSLPSNRDTMVKPLCPLGEDSLWRKRPVGVMTSLHSGRLSVSTRGPCPSFSASVN